jgi:nitroreductase
MDVIEAIRARRSIKRFTPQPVTHEQIETLLDVATLAPNHRLTQPWRFYVLGPAARHAYGMALGERKARKQPDPESGRALKDTVAREHLELPAMIAVAVVQSDEPEIAREDYAAAMMALLNLSLAALDLGLGTHIKTGGVMDDAAARSAAGVRDSEKIVAIVNIGTPANVPPPKSRTPAAELTTWRD